MKRVCLLAAILLSLPLVAIAGKDPSDYPLKVHVLQQHWSSHNSFRGWYRATGRGNVWEGDSVHGFDFKYDCSFGLTRTARNQAYLAKWKKPGLRLELLAMQIGKEGKYQDCELETTVRGGVYIRTHGDITEMSQDEYKDRLAKRAAARAAQASQAPAGAATVAKLSIGSNPPDAEVEVDGDFMGNTPSVFELSPGEHTIVVQKSGYASWEKKMKLVPGEIRLNAELQQQAP
jgi:hypothetical protein